MLKRLVSLLIFVIPLVAQGDPNESLQLPDIHISEHEFVRFLKTFCKRYEEQFPDKVKAAHKKYKKALELSYKSDELKEIVLTDCNCHSHEAMYQKYAKEMLDQALQHHRNELNCAARQMHTLITKLRDISIVEIQESEQLEQEIEYTDVILKKTSDDKGYAQNEVAKILARAQLRYSLGQQALRLAYHQHAIRAIQHALDEIDDSRWTFFNPLKWLF
jgi:hypothetical protein